MSAEMQTLSIQNIILWMASLFSDDPVILCFVVIGPGFNSVCERQHSEPAGSTKATAQNLKSEYFLEEEKRIKIFIIITKLIHIVSCKTNCNIDKTGYSFGYPIS